MHALKGLLHRHDERLHPRGTDAVASGVENIFAYRKQRGVNLGAWFVLERWITNAPFQFAEGPGHSDLDMARGKDAKLILESHWDTWISEDDWDWLAERGINTVRIPIGYYHICGADRTVLDGTDFFPYYNVYVGAWARIIQAIENAARRGIGVLLDLHAAPGKQNDDAHAGTSDRANFFNDSHNQKCTVHALRVLVNNIVSHQPPLLNVVGVELINEPRPPSDHALQSWYTFAMHELRSSKIPIYLGDCWRTEFYANYLVDERPSTLTVLDHHLYRCFTESDIRTSAESHTLSLADPNAETPVMLARAAEKLGRVGCGIVIGEWSGALNPGSLRGGTKEKEDYVRAQLDLFEEHCGGWFFWTYKKQDRGDTGWSLRDAVQAGIFPPWVGLKAKRSAIGDEGRWREARDGQKQRSLQLHAEYWKKLGISKHELFEVGFRDGWDISISTLRLSQLVWAFFDLYEPKRVETSHKSQVGK